MVLIRSRIAEKTCGLVVCAVPGLPLFFKEAKSRIRKAVTDSSSSNADLEVQLVSKNKVDGQIIAVQRDGDWGKGDVEWRNDEHHVYV